MARLSWLRELMNTTATPRTGRPFLNVLKMCGAIGSTKTETAAVMQIKVEKMNDIIDGKNRISVQQADRLRMYFEVLWWWHCYRSDRNETMRAETIKAIFLRCRPIWEDLPVRLAEDWSEAYARHVDKVPAHFMV